MSMQDPISDMLTRLRNGCMSMQKVVSMPSSIMKTAIAEVLKQEGYIADASPSSKTSSVFPSRRADCTAAARTFRRSRTEWVSPSSPRREVY